MIAPKFVPRHPSQGWNLDKRYVLKRFLGKLGIPSAQETSVEALLRALDANTQSFGTPDEIWMSPNSLTDYLKLTKK